jgi:hypothetical protein
MGILETAEKKNTVASPATRRKSGLDFGSLKPLDAAKGTKNFGGYREMQSPKAKQKSEDAMDSDADDEDDARADEMDDDKDVVVDKGMLSPEDAAKQGELAEGVRKIKVCSFVKWFLFHRLTAQQLKRQHSAEPLARGPSVGESSSGSPVSGTPGPGNSAAEGSSSTAATADSEGSVASPFKKHRASLPGFDENVRKSLGQALLGAQKERGNSEGTIPTTTAESKMEEDEEL